jgi:lipopolysaccharide export LptBFGC system permease protein LptF
MRALVVLGALVALGTFGVAAELTPRANARLQIVMAGRPVPRTDRAMTIPELRVAAAKVRVSVMQPSDVRPSTVNGSTVWSARAAQSMRANYAVEIHKKFVIAGACLVLALAGFTIGWRLPNSGTVGLVVASVVVFSLYLVGLMAGESLADQLILPPWAAMWLVNVVGVALVLLALPRGPTPEEYAPSRS